MKLDSGESKIAVVVHIMPLVKTSVNGVDFTAKSQGSGVKPL